MFLVYSLRSPYSHIIRCTHICSYVLSSSMSCLVTTFLRLTCPCPRLMCGPKGLCIMMPWCTHDGPKGPHVWAIFMSFAQKISRCSTFWLKKYPAVAGYLWKRELFATWSEKKVVLKIPGPNQWWPIWINNDVILRIRWPLDLSHGWLFFGARGGFMGKVHLIWANKVNIYSCWSIMLKSIKM
jgi:hypothetical protein